jgi:hypothetical protein
LAPPSRFGMPTRFDTTTTRAITASPLQATA